MTAYKVNKIRVQQEFTEPSMTKQAFYEESEINKIMAKYEKTGLIEHVSENKAEYFDAPDVEDFHAAMVAVKKAEQFFNGLPSGVRRRFNNDAGTFLEFIGEAENRDHMVERGELPPEASNDTPAVETADPPEAGGE